MLWTKEDKAVLQSFKDRIDSDDIKIKEQIKKVLIQNRYIMHVLHNKELEEVDAEPEDYFGVCVLPYYLIQPTQSNVKNFLCYEVNYDELDRYNRVVKKLEIVFYIICHNKDIIDGDTGIARHDLLAALLQDEFNYTNYFGSKIRLVSDVASVVDTDYACRTLTFEQITDNNVVKTRDNTPIIANKEIHTLAEKS